MEDFIEKLKNSNVKEVSRLTGIPYDRMAKWVQGKGSPKKADADKLEEYFSGTNSNSKDNPNPKSMNSEKLISTLERTISTQEKLITRLETENEQLRSENATLRSDNRSLREQIDRLEADTAGRRRKAG